MIQAGAKAPALCYVAKDDIIRPRGEDMYKNILFDFDGTVFDTVEGITKSAQYALKQQGIEAELQELRCFAGPPLVDKFMEVYGFDRETAEQATRDFKARYEPIGVKECRVFPGIKEVLQALIKAGARVGIATSKPQHLAEQLLAGEEMLGLFQVICGSEAKGNNNAKWQVLQRAMDALGAKPEDTILVGDTKYDVEGAKRCGVACLGVRYGYAAEGELEAAGAIDIVEDMAGLQAWLLK